MVSNFLPTAQLFLVPAQQAAQVVHEYLKKIWCNNINNNSSCDVCYTCLLITQNQHHGFLWIAPEKRYTLELLEPVFKKIALQSDENSLFFFIIERADLLTTACANSLLKLVEEPPAGYYFIFTAQQEQQVLPTIRSRCTLQTLTQKDQYSYSASQAAGMHDFGVYFMHKTDPLIFLKELSASALSEIEVSMLVEQLLTYWVEQYKQEVITQNLNSASTYSMVNIMQRALLQPIMPGSSKLFLKNLYLAQQQIFQQNIEQHNSQDVHKHSTDSIKSTKNFIDSWKI